MRIVFLTTFLGLSLAVSDVALAETEPLPPPGDAAEARENEPAGTTIVTAARRDTAPAEAPAMVTVIDREDLKTAPEKTVDDVLKRIPGVSFSRLHAAECGPGREITLRGLNDQKRTLVLVDGIPVNDGVTGAVPWSLIPLDAVDRIEVVRGPMSALYGSGAMGGVVNIITRQPVRPNETTVKGSYGSLRTASGSLLQGGQFRHGGYLLGANLYRTDGYIQSKERMPYHVKNARTDLAVFGKGFVFPDARSRLTGSIDYVNEEYSRGIRTDRQNNQTLAAALRYDRRHDNGLRLAASAHARLLWRKVELGARPDYAVRDHVERDDGMRFGQSFQADFPLAGFNTISVGLDATQSVMKRKNDYDLVERDSRARGKQLGASIFAQDEMRFPFGKHVLLVTPGVRLDYLRSYDGSSVDSAPGPNPPVEEDYPDRAWVAANPKLALVYRYDDWTTVRVSAGRSFAAPTLFELHTVFTRGPLLLYGNPDLDPETSWSAELGIDQRLGRGLLARATGYYTRGFDFIGYRDLGNNQSRLDNITGIQVAGVDTELRFDPHPMWSIYGGYTFNRSTVVKDLADAAIEGNRLPFEPVHRARLGVVFRYLEWIAVDLAARYEGERDVDLENTAATRLDDHFTLDLGLSGRFLGHVGWALAFENLLDRKYDVYSVPTEASQAPGFQVRGSLSFSF